MLYKRKDNFTRYNLHISIHITSRIGIFGTQFINNSGKDHTTKTEAVGGVSFE